MKPTKPDKMAVGPQEAFNAKQIRKWMKGLQETEDDLYALAYARYLFLRFARIWFRILRFVFRYKYANSIAKLARQQRQAEILKKWLDMPNTPTIETIKEIAKELSEFD